mmetsp:Transcript_33856/g.79139  ORF Transcript_33856/g.79139 Transcript_33856/m.79139 type:complete len:496 (-) Transcript_33856:26-1513(-)
MIVPSEVDVKRSSIGPRRVSSAERPASARTRRELGDRRRDVAMKLMGITPRDLEPVGDDVDEKRADLLQQRTDVLQRQLENKVSNLTDEYVHMVLDAERFRERRRLKDNPLLGTAKAQVDDMRARARSEIQQKAARQIEKRQEAENFSKQWQLAAQQLKETRLQEEQAALNRLEEKQKKLDSRLAAQKAADTEARRNIVSKIKEGEDRVQRNLDELAKEREVTKERHQTRHRYVAQKCEQHEEDLRQLNLQRRQQAEDHIERVRAFKESQKEYFAKREEERSAEYARKMAKVEETMQARTEKLEKDLAEHLEKMKAARQIAQESKDKVRERVQSQFEGRRKKWTANVQAQSQSRRERVAALKQAIVTKFEKSEAGREQYREGTVGKHSKVREVFRELVDLNKAQLERSHECARELTLANIQMGRAKHELMGEQKQEAQKYRAEAVKESLCDRALLQELCDRVSPKRVSAIAEKLGLPPLNQDGGGKEGDDGEQKQ